MNQCIAEHTKAIGPHVGDLERGFRHELLKLPDAPIQGRGVVVGLGVQALQEREALGARRALESPVGRLDRA